MDAQVRYSLCFDFAMEPRHTAWKSHEDLLIFSFKLLRYIGAFV
jgi:hypothetical protein